MSCRTTIAGALLALLAACAVAVPLAGAQSDDESTATVKLSSSVTGARPVALTLTVSYEMQCGYPGPGPVRVVFPTAEHLPTTIAPRAVLVDGKAASSVQVKGHTLIVGLPAPPQIMCDLISSAKLTLVITRAAALGNPASRGSYTLRAERGDSSFSGRFTIHAA